jgi:hypothetical protein
VEKIEWLMRWAERNTKYKRKKYSSQQTPSSRLTLKKMGTFIKVSQKIQSSLLSQKYPPIPIFYFFEERENLVRRRGKH